MRKLLLGNEAVARGLYEAGCRVASSYPGTPSTEVTESAAKYNEIYCEWAPNEKVAMETAGGAAIAGARSFCGMKHVGLNVAADPLFTLSYTGVNAGMVIVVADDPGMHSSQNEQDSRNYAKASKIPMLEPADSQECLAFTKLAYDISERYDTPVIIRLTTRISHSRSLVEIGERVDNGLKEYVKDTQKYVMMPAMAKKKHVIVEERTKALEAWGDSEAVDLGVNKIEYNDKKIGIIAGGIAYQYAKEALGDKASYLKIGCLYPLPEKIIRDFAAECEKVYVIEELDSYIEDHCRKLGINVIGKEQFTLLGEYSQSMIKKVILGEENAYLKADINVPARPPVLCAGCPHRGLFYALKKLKVNVSGDIGCYTLGNAMPLDMVDTCLCMGAGIDIAQGIGAVTPGMKCFAFVGDSTFFASSITGIINGVYNQADLTVCILDNSTTAMTGHQPHPGTGHTMMGQIVDKVSIEETLKGIGVKTVRTVDPLDLEAAIKAVKDVASEPGVKAIIFKSPCIAIVKPLGKAEVLQDACRKCKKCIREIGCPGIVVEDGKIMVDASQCTGCGICADICPFDAIEVTSFEKREGSAK